MMILDKMRLDYAKWYQWHSGDLTSLFNISPTQVNGLALIKPNEIQTQFNYFAAYSRFFWDAMINDIPDMATDDAQLIWQLSRDWSITGECCLIITDGQRRTIRPEYVFPQSDNADADTILSYLLVFPTHDEDGNLDGKAKVIDYKPGSGVGKVSIREFGGGVLGDSQSRQDIPIERLLYINTYDGIYGQIAGIVREINMRMAMLQSSLNTMCYPILEISMDAFEDGAFTMKYPTPADIAKKAKQGIGLLTEPPFSGEQGARYVERQGKGLEESQEHIRLLLGQLAIMSGVPDYVYGVNLNQTPGETERILFAGQARVSRYRRALEQLLSQINIQIDFRTEPFTTRKTRNDSIIKLVETGIITIAEARTALGY